MRTKTHTHKHTDLSRRREHIHARAFQIRAELSTHIHRETGPQRPTHSFWSFLFEKTKLECGKTPPAFRQRQAHNAVRHAARSRPARSAPGHRARTRASSRKRRYDNLIEQKTRKVEVNPNIFTNNYVPIDQLHWFTAQSKSRGRLARDIELGAHRLEHLIVED